MYSFKQLTTVTHAFIHSFGTQASRQADTALTIQHNMQTAF